jgi:uncharacterized protein (UPF0276 family)
MNDKSDKSPEDRVGLGWRPEIGLDILEQLDEIDIIEVTAENCTHLSRSELKAFNRLSSHVDIVVHAISLGMASTYAVSSRHLDAVARVINAIEPEAWSEHLAFVRTPDRELCHLAAPPWSEETVETTVKNIHVASKAIGSLPHLENIATLYHPVGSTMSEADWTTKIIKGARTKLLIDLENIYANSRNFRTDWLTDMLNFPLAEVHYVHIAGGHEAADEAGEYFLDDHLHPVAEEVYILLEELASRVSQPLTVILERDGNYPVFEQTKSELNEARKALSRGRKRQSTTNNALKRC